MTIQKLMTAEGLPLVSFTPDDLHETLGVDLPAGFMAMVRRLADVELSYPSHDSAGNILMERGAFLSLCYQIATGKNPPA